MGHPAHVAAERPVSGRRVELLEGEKLGARSFAQRGCADGAQPEPAGKPTLALTRAARQGREHAGIAAEQRHDAIRFAVADGAEHDGAGYERSHLGIIAGGRTRGSSAAKPNQA